MYILLTKQEIQLLSLIEFLYDNKEKVPMQELRRKYEFSHYNINNLLNQLNLLISRVNTHENVHIRIINHQQSIELVADENIPIELMKEAVVRSSLTYTLAIELLLKRYTSAKDFCDEHFINFSIFKQVSDRLNNQLAKFNCHLNLKRREKICGNETDFRSFFYSLFFISGTSLVPFLAKNNQAQLKNFIEIIKNRYPYFTYTDLRKLKLIMSIGLLRYQAGFTITDYPKVAAINLAFPYPEFQLLVNDCFIDEQTKRASWQAEIRFYYDLFSTLTMYSLEQIETINFANLAIMGMDQSPHTTWIFEKCSQLQLNLSALEVVFLLVNLSNASERLTHFPIEEELSYEVANVSLYEKQYPNVSRTTDYFLKRLPFAKYHPLDALFKETIFLIIRSVLLNKQVPVKILLHSSINQIQEKWLTKEIANYCDVPLKFVNHIQEIPDLVITDKKNPLFHASRTFYWHPVPYLDEYYHLKHVVRKIYFDKLRDENSLEEIGC
ncbi:hypothetical protein CUS66_01185 [Enterococcus faecalis]|uniref:helix-turn-helix domain-containing protein n=1 Tax=Enterococcus faecalis TaxID=1351 RepID=UPI000CF1F4E1|nr:helix-turn-helix domain-containing protein [Enterococcus faecalis]PQF57956.1 hypothetical protein CUS66_01185 [Enterococcus faecalis]